MKATQTPPFVPASKLPDVGTTIFTVMSELARAHGALNLSQGFPDFDGPRYLLERVLPTGYWSLMRNLTS